MANKMLIDATHPEETRVVVLRGNRVEEFDFETAHRKQLRGNIYLAKVTRVEPSLQAAFVDYGGNRHGFLAFSRNPSGLLPDPGRRPAGADRRGGARRSATPTTKHDRRGGRRGGRTAGASAARAPRRDRARANRSPPKARRARQPKSRPATAPASTSRRRARRVRRRSPIAEPPRPSTADRPRRRTNPPDARPTISRVAEPTRRTMPSAEAELAADRPDARRRDGEPTRRPPSEAPAQADTPRDVDDDGDAERPRRRRDEEEEVVESVGGADALEEVPERAPRYRRQYKIQEVIKRRQVMLVQVVKEERGTKGAALTTYLSLAGRYSVLMPNTARGGGITRKITSADDRKRLKEIAEELEVPEGMGVILRTAGASRTKAEVKRDFEYLLRLWETVRDLTLKSTAPTLVYEEGSLIKRSIRDLYNKDIDEIVVAGDERLPARPRTSCACSCRAMRRT